MIFDPETWGLFLKAFVFNPPWPKGSYREVFLVSAYIKLFNAFVLLITSSAIYMELRKAPRFISRIILVIMIVALSIMIVQVGFIFHWFSTPITYGVGLLAFCFYTFLDILIYFAFAISYWETALNISSFMKRLAATD